MSGTVFISYSRKDMTPISWIERLRLYLAQNRHKGGLEVWDDSKIVPGADWRQSISTALTHCQAAILLVGPGFLASEFVTTEELPKLLIAARRRNLWIFPLIIKYAAYQHSVLEPFNAVNNPDEPLESLTTAEQNRVLNQLAINVYTALRGTASSAPGIETSNIAIVKAIQSYLSNTRTAFIAQAHRRNDLVAALEGRLGKRLDLEYEKLFFRYYPDLNADERFEFDQIRAMTEGPLYEGNRKLLELLETHPEVTEEIPSLLDLQQHLVFWLNKYERVFKLKPEMCLLYTGVEDAVPFPDNLDSKIEKWLRGQTKRGK